MFLVEFSIAQKDTGNNEFKLNVHFQNRAIQHHVFSLQKVLTIPVKRDIVKK